MSDRGWRALERAIACARAGRHAEHVVSEQLVELQWHGYLVVDNVWPDDRGGDVDHLVLGRSGAFAIETKYGPPTDDHVEQAAGNAIRCQRAFGAAVGGPFIALVCPAVRGAPAAPEWWLATSGLAVGVVAPGQLAGTIFHHRGAPVGEALIARLERL